MKLAGTLAIALTLFACVNPADETQPQTKKDVAVKSSNPSAESTVATQPTDKPNIIVIYADDLGYGDVGSYGATRVDTPNIDKLAAQGRRFTDAHSAAAVCSPSRYALLTGEYPVRAKMWSPIFHRTSLKIDVEKETIPSMLKTQGYQSAIIGKWHLGFGDTEPVDWNKPLKPGPLELGFDYYYGLPVVNSHPPFFYVENHNVVGLDPEDPIYSPEGKDFNARPFNYTREFDEKYGMGAVMGGTEAHKLYEDRMVGTNLTERAVNWIKQDHGNSPFFLYFSTTNIHHPYTPAPQFIGSSRAGMYGDYIHELDWMVGRLMKALEEEGIADNTLVIFTSDNGPMLSRGGQEAWEAGHEISGPLLGMKFGAWEGGHRIPLIARWPGKIPAGSTSDILISQVDFMATFAYIANAEVKPNAAPDSLNIVEAFTGDPTVTVRDSMIISPREKTHISLRRGKWMYIPAQGEGGFDEIRVGSHKLGGVGALPFLGRNTSDVVDGKLRDDAPPAQLYDLEADLAQSTNVHDAHPDVVVSMHAELLAELGQEIWDSLSIKDPIDAAEQGSSAIKK